MATIALSRRVPIPIHQQEVVIQVISFVRELRSRCSLPVSHSWKRIPGASGTLPIRA